MQCCSKLPTRRSATAASRSASSFDAVVIKSINAGRLLSHAAGCISPLSLLAAAASVAVVWDGAAAEPLAWLWGATLAVVMLLVPAVAPRPMTEGS
jgi:hypothetical protein